MYVLYFSKTQTTPICFSLSVNSSFNRMGAFKIHKDQASHEEVNFATCDLTSLNFWARTSIMDNTVDCFFHPNDPNATRGSKVTRPCFISILEDTPPSPSLPYQSIQWVSHFSSMNFLKKGTMYARCNTSFVTNQQGVLTNNIHIGIHLYTTLLTVMQETCHPAEVFYISEMLPMFR